MNDNNVQNGNGAQGEPQGWVEKMVDAYGNAMWTWAIDGTLENHQRASQARQDLIQAIQAAHATARAEEDDFITVRDHFAGLALQADVSTCEKGVDSYKSFDVLAETAYKVADAMLKARKGGAHVS